MEVHIVAHNAEEYRDSLAAKFPELDYHLAQSREDFTPAVYNADILIFFGTQGSEELYTRCKNLKWIQALGTGVDGITNVPTLAKEIIVTNMRGIHGPQCAEMTLLLMMALGRRIPTAVRNQMDTRWARRPGSILEGKTLGILGVGIIGEALAIRCQPFGLKVIGITDHPRELPGFDNQVPRSQLANVAQDVDYLVVLVPYNDKSERIINEKILTSMKPSAYLVNIARGEVIDDAALIDALESESIAGAALDVFRKEPLPHDDPLWTTKNLLITPHYAGMVEEYGTQALPVAEHNMKAFLVGDYDAMINQVDH